MPGRVYNAAVGGPERNSGGGVALRIEPEIGGVDVVVGGDFNPAIFTPAWFVLHDLLPGNVADNAQVQVIHPQITEFTMEREIARRPPPATLIGKIPSCRASPAATGTRPASPRS